jgi:hypothetical protein
MRPLLPVTFCGLLLLVGCHRTPHARVDPALAPLVPADTVLMAGLRLDKLKDTPFFKKYVESGQWPALEQLRKSTGLDARRDIWEIDVALQSGPKRPLTLVRGKFGGEFGLEPQAKGLGLERSDYKGYYLLHSGGAGVTFFNTGAAVAGAVEDLKRVIDTRDNPRLQAPEALLSLVETLPASAQFWLVAPSGPALLPVLPAQGNLANLRRLVTPLGESTFFGDLGNGLQLSGQMRYANPSAAREMHDALKGLLGLARLNTPSSKPDLLKFYEGFKLELKDADLHITVQEPLELMDRVISSLPESRPQGSSNPRPR